jgi:hypothetical protein
MPQSNTRASLRAPGTCGYADGPTACAHPRDAHKYDEVDDKAFCDECWADTDERMHEISYHSFNQGVYARV